MVEPRYLEKPRFQTEAGKLSQPVVSLSQYIVQAELTDLESAVRRARLVKCSQ
jgi:hypothetical protein